MLFALISTFGCGADEPTTKCVGIWEVEFLHDGATAEIVDGKLQLRIDNPQTDHDIRLIQRQTDYHVPGHLGAYVYFENFDSETTGANNFDMQLKAWFAYNYAPETVIVSHSTGTYGVRAVANGVTYINSGVPHGFITFGGSGTQISFNGIDGTITIPEIQTDAKTFYIDFGVRQNTGTGKSSYISVDIPEVSFSNNIGKDEFLNDSFGCNSLIQ